MGSTLNAYLKKLEEFKDLPAGQPITIRVTDQDATEIAREYLVENKAGVSQRIQKRTGLKLSVDNPSVSFRNDEIRVSASGQRPPSRRKSNGTASRLWPSARLISRF